MLETVHCILLRTIKYSDTSSIATVWTAERGRMSVLVPSGGGREAQRRRAIMMPLAIFEGVARAKAGQEVASMSDVKLMLESPAATGNPARSVIAMFLADFLYSVLKESSHDELLSQFLFQALHQLGTAQGTALANFHLYFTYKMGQFIGISPDAGTYHPGRYFDMKEGRFSPTLPLHSLVLTQEESRMAWLLSRLVPRNIGLLRLNRNQRNRILDRILEYYTLHYAPVQNLPSLAFIRDVWGD